MLPTLNPMAYCEVILHYAANNKPNKTETIMAKTRFTEIRLGAITRKLEFEMWYVLNQMSNNIKKFEAGERTARETRMRHRTLCDLFLQHDRNLLREIRAANRIDRCESETERYYRSKDSCDALCKFCTLCEFFEK